MKCMQCGGTMKTSKETHLYDREGLKVALNGVPVHRCRNCGDFEVEIRRIDDLNRIIVDAIIRQRGRLVGAEIRFLRKSLGWSAGDFARHIGVDTSTISRWENGAQEIGRVADRLLRLMVKVGTPIADYSLNDLASLPEDEAPVPRPIRVRQSTQGWRRENTVERDLRG